MQVIEALKECKADIIALQEVDIGCDRSAGLDTGTSVSIGLTRDAGILSISKHDCSHKHSFSVESLHACYPAYRERDC